MQHTYAKELCIIEPADGGKYSGVGDLRICAWYVPKGLLDSDIHYNARLELVLIIWILQYTTSSLRTLLHTVQLA